jgi:DNL zinc finger
MGYSLLIALAMVSALSGFVFDILHTDIRRRSTASRHFHIMARRTPREEGTSNGNDDQSASLIPQLPPIGDSSFLPPKKNATADDRHAAPNSNNNKPFVANHKIQLQYTCKVCETRNTHKMSRIAYRQGVVIATCKGCATQHLIADHLGWSGFPNNTVLEDFLGTVPRVTQEVFELERILQQYGDTSGGAIVGDDGKLALE